MKQRMHRVLSLLLSVVLVLGMLPATAFATITNQNTEGFETAEVATPSDATPSDATPSDATQDEEEKDEVSKLTATRNHTGDTFATMDDLVALVDSLTSPDDRNFYYTGSGDFEINKNLIVPGFVGLVFGDSNLVVNNGVTFTAECWIACNDMTVNGNAVTSGKLEIAGSLTVAGTMSNTWDIEAGDLIVSGEMNADGWINVKNSADIFGTLSVNNGMYCGSELKVEEDAVLILNNCSIDMEYPCTVSIKGTLNYSNDRAIQISYSVASVSEMETALTVASNQTNPLFGYFIWIDGARANTRRFDLINDIAVPENTRLQWDNIDWINIQSGTTVTVNGKLQVYIPLNVYGNLVNNRIIEVANQTGRDYRPPFDGVLEIFQGGQYSGDGTMHVYTDKDATGISHIIKGLNMAFDSVVERDHILWFNVRSGLIKLATPTQLTWGVEYRETWWNEDPATGKISVRLDKRTKPGFMSWKTEEPDQARVQVHIYRVGDSQPCASEQWGFDPQLEVEFRSADTFMRHDLPSGDYYFTVQSLGDYIDYSNSDVAKSGVYKFRRPASNLPAVTNLTWEDRNDRFIVWANWDGNSTSRYVDGFEANLYYSETKNGTYEQCGGSRGRGALDTESPFADHFFQEKGEGYYKYKVRYLSGNMDKIGNGPWSDFSPVLDMKKIPQSMEDDLDRLEQNAHQMTASDIRTAVQNMDTEDLKKTLLVDQENDGATKTLADLEDQVGGQAPVYVSQAASAFNANDVSVVGANLNNSASETNPITLVIDKPMADHVIPERFNSAVSVRFSMTLANVADPHNLEVPVKISLPVPASINPDYLVILHYHADGTREWIWPHIYRKNGKFYADFVVTGFSEFIMTEEFPENENNSGNYDTDNRDDRDDHVSSSVKAKAETLPDYVVSGQWSMTNGKWMFRDKTGEVYKNRWAAVVNPYADPKAGQSSFDWFFFDAEGNMMTGWIMDGGRWYYLNLVSDGTQGRMFTGWQLINGVWYYLNPISDGTKGAMLADTWVGEYYVNADGAWEPDKVK